MKRGAGDMEQAAGSGRTADWTSLTKLAEAGQPKAQFTMGVLLFTGASGKPDRSKALEWFERAATSGSSDAQFTLGQCFQFGMERAADVKRAAHWYEIAARGGHAQARWNIANMLLSGNGVPKDPAKAIAWLELAAHDGFDRAAVALGRLYEEGVGAPVNRDKAAYWFQLAAAKDNAEGQYCLALLELSAGDDRKRAHAAELLMRAARAGLQLAELELAKCYLQGIGVAEDHARAVEWLARAASKGHVIADYFLGLAY